MSKLVIELDLEQNPDIQEGDINDLLCEADLARNSDSGGMRICIGSGLEDTIAYRAIELKFDKFNLHWEK